MKLIAAISKLVHIALCCALMACCNVADAQNTSGGVMTISGGTYRAQSEFVANGTGTLVMGGSNSYSGGITVNAGTLSLNSQNAYGAPSVTGGTLTTGLFIAPGRSLNRNVVLGSGTVYNGDFTFTGSSNLNLGAGTITVSTVNSTSTPVSGSLTVNGVVGSSIAGNLVKHGAGTLTLNGLSINGAGQTTGNGVAAGAGGIVRGLTVSGGGFIDMPRVVITGGGGVGATAVAVIDYATGNLTGIRLTNPGSGYTSAPTFELVGGGTGNTGTISGTAVLTANVGNQFLIPSNLTPGVPTLAQIQQSNALRTTKLTWPDPTSPKVYGPFLPRPTNSISIGSTGVTGAAGTIILSGGTQASGGTLAVNNVVNTLASAYAGALSISGSSLQFDLSNPLSPNLETRVYSGALTISNVAPTLNGAYTLLNSQGITATASGLILLNGAPVVLTTDGQSLKLVLGSSSAVTVPEPSTFVLTAFGLAALGAVAVRKRNRKRFPHHLDRSAASQVT